MKKSKLIILALFVLSACSGDARQTLGMDVAAPDEFAVERKPKLDVPPSFKLRPPTPGAAPVNAADTRDQAKELITGTSAPVKADSATEKTFLTKVGADTANPDIRTTLTKEYGKGEDKDFIDRLRSITPDKSTNTLVDPEKESERIQGDIKDNKPVTEGETPTKNENAGKSWFEKIFD